MARRNQKRDILDEAGYIYNFDRMMFINRKAKKAFSFEYIDDHPESVIESKISEQNDSDDWRFYTDLPMSAGTEKELKRVLQ
jgi:hypothetical protein